MKTEPNIINSSFILILLGVFFIPFNSWDGLSFLGEYHRDACLLFFIAPFALLIFKKNIKLPLHSLIFYFLLLFLIWAVVTTSLNSVDISNYFFASKCGNAHLEKMIDIILRNIEENTLTNVFALTGPYVFHEVLNDTEVNTVSYRFSVHQGNFTNEHFQYIDKPQGKWTRAQDKVDLVK